MRDAFAFVAQRFWSPNPDADALNTAFLAASAAAIDDLGAAVAQRAVVLGMPAMVCANEWALDWSRSIAEVRDPIDLSLHVYRFAHKVSPPEAALAPLPPPTVPPVSPAQPRRRAAMSTTARKRGATVKARGDSITKVDVRAEYRAATMLPQAYGVWFNARLVLRYADYRVTDWTAAAKLLSGLTHELGMRLRDRTGDAGFRLHWLCQHEADEGGLRTWLLMHIPGDEVRCAREWIVEHLPEPEGFPYKVLGEDVWRAPAVLGRPHELHWSLVRELWRPLSLDIEERDKSGRRSLRDLLQVPPQAPRVAGTLPAGFRRYSSSKTLGTGQWKAACADGMGFVSAFDAAAFDTRAWLAVDAGWERDELAYRRVEIARRQTEIDALRALFPADMSPVDEAQFQQRLAALEASWELDPIRRPRPKPLW